jgi:hypothetical protein
MQFNILQLYLNGLVSFFTFIKLSTYLHELNHLFEFIETIIQMLHYQIIN